VNGRPVGRRLFLGGLAAGAATVAVGGGLPAAVRGLVERQLADLAPGDGFHFYSVTGSVPRPDAGSWRLDVGGLVRRPLRLSLEDLRRLQLRQVTADFHCVSGWSVSSVRWAGVPVAALLDAAGLDSEARAVRFESLDGAYEDDLDLEQAAAAGVLVGLELNGRPLSVERGAPARLVVPFFYGYKGVKWLGRMVLVRERRLGYWEQRGYDADARIRG
jgi:DMSO/TMAO reductase YedYZ molybdopterin-dependent catalytic subunit